MFITPAPNTIEHVDADCHCACCNQLHKPVKITALPSVLLRQSTSFVNETGLATAQSRSNVISISAAIKPAERVRAVKVEQANFKYPMLECS